MIWAPKSSQSTMGTGKKSRESEYGRLDIGRITHRARNVYTNMVAGITMRVRGGKGPLLLPYMGRSSKNWVPEKTLRNKGGWLVIDNNTHRVPTNQ